MSNEAQNVSLSSKELQQHVSFGLRLKNARESLGIELKEVAAQLRLNEKVLYLLEKDRFPSDLPVTFIRGYMRSYGKLLQIPEQEIKKAVELVKHCPVSQRPIATVNPTLKAPVTSGNYFMQFFTYLILCTLLGLVGMWWYTHNNTSLQSNEHHALQQDAINTIDKAPSSVNESLKEQELAANTDESDVEKLTNNANPGIMQSASASNSIAANIEEDLQASSDEIEANSNNN